MTRLLVNQKLLKVLLTLMLLGFFANSLAISYTVQVIALSSESNVKLLEERLKELGFPAYTITIPTNQGQIFRLRVGSFANREAAQKYAQAMQGVLDSAPVAQLAEGIPANLVPLEAKTLASFSTKDTIIKIDSKQDKTIIRIQTLGEFTEANYFIDKLGFTAYRAILTDDNKIVRVFSRRLWPEVYPLDSNTERDIFYQNTVAELAVKLDIEIADIQKYQFLNQKSEPFLVLVEQMDIKTGKIELLKALGKPASRINEYGPELEWFDSNSKVEIVESKPEIIITNQSKAIAKELETQVWIARSQNNFTELEIIATKQKWLLVAGQPIWATEGLLLTKYNDTFELYQLK